MLPRFPPRLLDSRTVRVCARRWAEARAPMHFRTWPKRKCYPASNRNFCSPSAETVHNGQPETEPQSRNASHTAIETRSSPLLTSFPAIPRPGASPDVVLSPAWGSPARLVLKRMIDILSSAALLILLSRRFLILAVVVKLGSPAPIFYRWMGVGRSAKPFLSHKF